MRKHDVQDCLNDSSLSSIYPTQSAREKNYYSKNEIFKWSGKYTIAGSKNISDISFTFIDFFGILLIPALLVSWGFSAILHSPFSCSQGGTIWVESKYYEASSQLVTHNTF